MRSDRPMSRPGAAALLAALFFLAIANGCSDSKPSGPADAAVDLVTDGGPDGALSDETEVMVLRTVTAGSAGGNYVQNRAPLRPRPFLKLPIGAITARGWLRQMLEREAKGMVGQLEAAKLSSFLAFENSAWTAPDGSGPNGWEELPYWLKGYGDLGYVLRDDAIKSAARRWIDAILASQRVDGYFGSRGLLTALNGTPDMWPHMPMLNVLRSFHEATGDERVIPFLTKYFEWQQSQPAAHFAAGYWPRIRFGDNLDSVYWLYNRTGHAWLLDLAQKIHENMQDWTGGVKDLHGVNIAQGFKEPGIYFQQSQEVKHLEAAGKNYLQVMEVYGQFPGGGFASDERIREGYTDPRQGFETCSIVEFMHSFELLTQISGDPLWADRCEELAFNTLPASMSPEHKSLHYLTAANQVQLDRADKAPCIMNPGDMITYSPKGRYRCCQHNVSHGWPYFTEELWLATWDGGLLASLYAPSAVEAKVGEGKTVKLTLETDYPFGDTITITVAAAEPVTFPLYLRLPGWVKAPELAVNGKTLAVTAPAPAYLSLRRAWREGDRVTLRLPMAVAVRTWAGNQGAASVDYGPLTFSLKIGESWQRFGGTEAWPDEEVLPTTPWNYGLVLDPADPAAGFAVQRQSGPLAVQPFSHAGTPLTIQAKAKKIPEWTVNDAGIVGLLNASPIATGEPEETVTLIPMGAARLRLTMFPVIAGSGGTSWVNDKTCE